MEPRNAEGLTEKEFLEQYNPGDYPRPSVTTDMILFTINENYQLNVLLIKRKNHPYINKWALPGGFCGIDESLDDCARRELKEETGVDAYLEQLYTFSEPNRDPRMRVISTTYMALIPKDSVNVVAGDDASDAQWWTVIRNTPYMFLGLDSNTLIHYEHSFGKLTPTTEIELAFDHVQQLELAFTRLRNKIWYDPIAFNLLPEKFSLDEVQKVYEAILDTKLVKSNFRTRIAKFVECTNELQTGVAHRPSKLYTLKEEYRRSANV